MLARLNHPNIVAYKAAWLEPNDNRSRKSRVAVVLDNKYVQVSHPLFRNFLLNLLRYKNKHILKFTYILTMPACFAAYLKSIVWLCQLNDFYLHEKQEAFN